MIEYSYGCEDCRRVKDGQRGAGGKKSGVPLFDLLDQH